MKIIRFVAYLVAAIGFSQASAGSYEDFFQALIRDDAPAVRKLVGQGLDPNTRDEHGQAGLYVALRAESYRAAEVLASQPTLDANARNEAGETALMMAALRGQIGLCKLLLSHGARVNQEGWTPLHYAASGGGKAVTALLLDADAQVDARSPKGLTPLMMAALYDSEAVVDLLLARGAHTQLRSDIGLSAADYARQSGREWLVPRLSVPARQH